MFRHQKKQKLPPSSADPVPPPLSGQPGEISDEHIQADQTEGDEGGGHSGLSNKERRRKAPKQS